MSSLIVVAMVLVGVWLGVLTLAVILLIRQLALISVRLDLAGPAYAPMTEPPYEPENDGPEIGSRIPETVSTLLPQLKQGRAYVVLLSATCTPCRTLAAELLHQHIDGEAPLIALVPGRQELADELVDMLPPSIAIHCDPTATALAKSFGIQSAPFALEIEGGFVTGRARLPYLRSAADLARFIGAQASPPSPERPSTKEVIGHGSHVSRYSRLDEP